MDTKVKGISWVGNVYQKFEAMCLEVEDVVCQETAKYVETQVKTVGSSVKKFYAEVLQDLLPHPEGSGSFLEQDAAFGFCEKTKLSIEEFPEKEESSTHDTAEISIPTVKDLCPELTDDVVVCKRSKVGIKRYPMNNKLPQLDLSDVITSTGNNSSHVSLRNRAQNQSHLLPSLSIDPADSRLPLEKFDNDEKCTKSHMSMEADPLKENSPLPDVWKLVAPAGKGTSQASSLSTFKEDLTKPSDAQTKITSSTSFELPICESHRTTGTSCSDRVVEIGCAAESSSAFQSTLVLPDASFKTQGVVNGLTTMNDISRDSDVTSAPYNLPLKESSWTEPEHFDEGVNHSGLDEGDHIVELVPETSGILQSTKLDESCIVVDSRELPFASQQAGKHRSYKKKIRDALASRMRSAKKQEYEQLAIWHGDTNDPPRIESSCSSMLNKDQKVPPSHDTGESEWELL